MVKNEQKIKEIKLSDLEERILELLLEKKEKVIFSAKDITDRLTNNGNNKGAIIVAMRKLKTKNIICKEGVSLNGSAVYTLNKEELV